MEEIIARVEAQSPSLKAFATKEQYLRRVTQRTPVVQKEDFIVELCRGARVLDIGCIDHSSSVALALGDNWLHHRISRASCSTVGLDILEKEAEALRKRGYDIRVGNAESFDLHCTFDVIVAGDIIEHLSNIGGFLTSVKRHMRENAIFVFTTPNALNLEHAARIAVRNRTLVHDQHTMWFDPTVVWELVSRHSLEIVDFRWVQTRFWIGAARSKIVGKLISCPFDLLMWFRPMWRRDFALVLRPAHDKKLVTLQHGNSGSHPVGNANIINVLR